nr:AAA family ATPase [Cohnella zeiphila]
MLPTTGSVSETVQIENSEPQLKFELVERRQSLSSSLTQRQRIFLPPTVAVYAAKGGIGKTTFLLHLAARLSQEGQKVCVLDTDFILGNVAAWMNITPHKTVVDLAHRFDDPEASRTCLLPVKEGFFIVASPPEPGALTLRSEQLLAILRFLKEEMDVVLIDTPQYIDNWTRLILEQTDLLFAMTSGDPASLINLERMRPALSRLQPTPDIQLVWNRLTEPATKEAWKERLPWPTALELPEDLTIRSAVRRGEWIADSPVSPYRLQIGRLMDQWMGRELRANEKGTRLMRLWSKFKAKGESMYES